MFYHNKVLCSFLPAQRGLFFFFFNPYLFFLSWGGVEEEKGSSLALSCFFHTIIYDVGHEEMHEGQEGERSAGMRSSRVTHVDQTCWQGTREGTSGWTWMGKRLPWDTKRRGQNMAPKSPRLGFRNNLLHSPSFLPFSVIFPSTSFSPLHSSIPGKLKKHDSLSVMEGLWEGLIAFSALFRCTNRPLLTIITQSSSIIESSSIFHALNMSQAPNLSLIVQKAMQACVRSQ